jgi:hypothetical protein
MKAKFKEIFKDQQKIKIMTKEMRSDRLKIRLER